MKNKLIQFIKQPIIAGSIWITAGSFLVSIGNYIYNLMMGRLLTPADYGTLIALISLSIVISLPTGIVGIIVTKFTAEFHAKKENEKIARLIKKFTLYSGIVGFAIMFLMILFLPALKSYLQIESSQLIILISIIIGIGILTSVNGGALRGLLRFRFLSIIGIVGVLIKLFLGWQFVSYGYFVSGALIALLFSILIPWLITYYPLRKYYAMVANKRLGLKRQVISYSFPSFAATSSLMLFMSVDLLLVKHYFPASQAGIYAAISVMGKAVFYLVSPAIQVIFPVIAQSFAKGKNVVRDVIQGLLIVLVPAVIVTIIYIVFPEFVVGIFFPSHEYRVAVDVIYLYAIFMLFYSVLSLFVNIFLAMNKSKLIYLSLVGAILQVVLIMIFHENLNQVLWASIISVGGLSFVYAYYLLKLILNEKK